MAVVVALLQFCPVLIVAVECGNKRPAALHDHEQGQLLVMVEPICLVLGLFISSCALLGVLWAWYGL